MLDLVLSFLLGAGILLGYLFLHGRLSDWRSGYYALSDENEKLTQRLEENSKALQFSIDKYTALTEYIKIQSERPVVAAIQEKHVQEIAGMLATLIQQNLPNRLN